MLVQRLPHTALSIVLQVEASRGDVSHFALEVGALTNNKPHPRLLQVLPSLVHAMCLALMDAGVPQVGVVTATSCGFLVDSGKLELKQPADSEVSH